MPQYINSSIRAIGTYFVLLVLARLMGKREISQMTFFDYIVGITIGSIAAIMAVDPSIRWLDVLPAVIIFGLFQIVFALFSIKSASFRRAVTGSPTILIENGKMKEKSLQKEKLSFQVLMAKLREKNAFKLADVEFAVLEPDGEISVLLKSDKQPVTPSDLKLQAQYSTLPRIVIENGKIVKEDLRDAGLTISWLMAKLAERGVYDISRVVLAQVDSSGSLYVDLYDEYEDRLVEDKSEDMILAKLGKIHADFCEYSLETQNEGAKKLYRECKIGAENLISQYKSYVEQKKN